MKKIVQAEGQHICKRRYNACCEEWQREVGLGEDGKRFVRKHIVLSTAKKNRYGGVLTYPLTPLPLSLCHIDGSMNKKTKSTLMEELEKSSVLNNQEMVDVVIVDGMFLLRFLFNLPETFGFVRNLY